MLERDEAVVREARNRKEYDSYERDGSMDVSPRLPDVDRQRAATMRGTRPRTETSTESPEMASPCGRLPSGTCVLPRRSAASIRVKLAPPSFATQTVLGPTAMPLGPAARGNHRRNVSSRVDTADRAVEVVGDPDGAGSHGNAPRPVADVDRLLDGSGPGRGESTSPVRSLVTHSEPKPVGDRAGTGTGVERPHDFPLTESILETVASPAFATQSARART